jgi:4-cresol dehydrogenase (hydroxylating)
MLNTKSLLEALTEVVGIHNVISNSEYLSEIETATYPTNQKINSVVKPRDKFELQKCIVIANEYEVPIHIISGGKNWGYGSRVPVFEQVIIFDLSYLNAINDYNETLGYVKIEPGVTYSQLFSFLRENKSELLISITSSSKESSIIGNIMERGIGTGLYADRLSNACCFEVLLPTGEFITTGFGNKSNSVSASVYKWGVGPYTDGLFTQSNLGVVTELTLWLMPCPDYFQLLFYQINDQDNFSLFTDSLQKLMMKGLVRPTVSLFNFHRIIAIVGNYPWENSEAISNAKTINKIELIRKKANAKIDVGLWNGEISVRGINKEHADMQTDLIKKAIAPFIEHLVVYEVSKSEMLLLLNEDQDSIDNENRHHDLVKDILIKKYLGIPNDNAIRQCYWKKKGDIPVVLDPDKDGCGLLWFSPIIPFQSNYLNKAIKTIESIVEKYGFEPAISLQCMSERCIHIIASISWDREMKGEDEKAVNCYKELRKILNEEGFHFYRESTLSMNEPYQENNYDSFLQKIKKSLDPMNILSPGRYIKNKTL